MKITAFSKTVAENIAKDIVASLSEVEAKYGVKISDKGGRFSSSNLTIKIDICTIADDGSAITKEAGDFTKYKEEGWAGIDFDLGDKFTSNGETFEVIGYNTRARKRPILTKSLKNGSQYVWSLNDVKRLIKAGK